MGAELLPVADRPSFARKMLAVWRLHHLAAGADLTICVYPGEWPDDAPREVKGVPVRDDDALIAGGPGGIFVLGRARESWRWAFSLASAAGADMSARDLAIMTAYGEVDNDRNARFWLSPDPVTGEVPMWMLTTATEGSDG